MRTARFNTIFSALAIAVIFVLQVLYMPGKNIAGDGPFLLISTKTVNCDAQIGNAKQLHHDSNFEENGGTDKFNKATIRFPSARFNPPHIYFVCAKQRKKIHKNHLRPFESDLPPPFCV